MPTRHLSVLLAAPLLAAPSSLGSAQGHAGASPEDAFAATWYDGRAELCGYRWRGERYGEERRGEAVAILVTEPYDARRHVKREDPADPCAVTALKLNLMRDFQTGIYDYDTTTSCFLRADDLALLELSFASMEWCGLVHESLEAGRRRLRLATHSYFEGESGERTLELPADGLVGEQLLVWLRGLHGPPLAPGETRHLSFLAGSFERRLRHAPAAWGTATLAREPETTTVEVPAGTFRALAYRIDVPDGRRGTFAIEEAAPHRLLAWTWTRGTSITDAAELTGSARLPYWELQAGGDEALRAELGLSVPGAGR